MSIDCDQIGPPAALADRADGEHADELPPMTPEAARRMAALLAPHVVAMRAVTSGTPYATAGASRSAPVSPAVTIFIAGMLEAIQS